MLSRDSHSSLQKNFQTQQTFKRNTRYFNVPEMMNHQNQDCIRRRKPMQSTDEQTQRKIDKSFTNSTAVLTSRVNSQIQRFSRRVSGEFSPQKSEYERQYSSPSSPKLRSFSIDKMISREHINLIRDKPIQDQRQFNNFKMQKHDLSKTCDFSKLKGRNLQFQLDNMNDLYHESKKAHDYCFYKQTTLKTKVNYKIQNKQKKRHFFIRKRASDFPATVLDPEKVDEGFKIATNYKGNNINHDKITTFYLTSGRELPCQGDMRIMTRLTNYHRDNKNQLVMPKVDFLIKKLKDDLIAQRKQIVKMPKNPEFTRDQVCDHKYFKSQLALKNIQKGSSS